MPDLIYELRREHTAIMDLLGQVSVMGASSKSAADRLMLLRAAVVGHVTKERQRLFPALRRMAARNPWVARALADFEPEMDAVTRDVLGFFARYPNGADGSPEFANAFTRCLGVIRTSIRKEETQLFARIASSSAARG